jgi:Tol biopolymer transport system component
MGTSLPPLQFLTSDADYVDYRPAADVTGKRVVFERTPYKGKGPTVLQVIDDIDSPNPVPFLSATSPVSQTRPDWCWNTNAVAFNGAASNNDHLSVWQVAGDGKTGLQEIPNTTDAAYPRWSLDGSLFVTENSGAGASPHPCNTIFDNSGNQTFGNVDGSDANGTPLFGGMPAVSATDLPRIAFAGQPALTGWGNSPSKQPHYDQNKNYIFLNTVGQHGTVNSSPMESGAAVSSYDASYQGRAPSWSPDGQTIVFESNRGDGINYAIYLCNVADGTITPVTDPSLNGQHAKFFPDGTTLILSIHHPGGTPPTRGIAMVDLSTLLQGKAKP